MLSGQAATRIEQSPLASLIVTDPRTAESVVEDLADLFRASLRDAGNEVPLGQELDLCRRYMRIEQLRMGPRLQVDWQLDDTPVELLRIPLLTLQPLLENAVYHGIEPSETPGVVSINVYAVRDRLHAVLRNPYRATGNHHAGNKMALGNIRERLKLHFDVAAELTARVGDNAYEVRIAMPYVKAPKS